MTGQLERRLAWLIQIERTFTADDLTADGIIAIDPSHRANGAQSGIGALFRWAAAERLIEWTGAVVKSKAPKRKGGAIRIWTGTAKGRQWARSVLARLEERA